MLFEAVYNGHDQALEVRIKQIGLFLILVELDGVSTGRNQLNTDNNGETT
jgi:hypothetical protein